MSAPPSIAGFRQRLEARELPAALATLGDILATKYSLADLEQLNRLITGHRAWLATEFAAPPVRLALLGGYTTQPIRLLAAPVLLAEHRLCDCYESSYNTWRLEVLNPESAFYAFKPTMVLLALGTTNLEKFPAVGASDSAVATLLDATVQDFQVLWRQITARTGATVIQHTFALPAVEPAGRLGAREAWSATRFISALNERLWKLDGRGGRLLDVASVAARTGLDAWGDPRWFHHSKHGFNPAAVSVYGQVFAGQLRAQLGRNRKCLVLDLDDTLWGGTVGDDGPEGIRLGPGTAEGEAFAAFWQYLRQLRARGVLLAVNSRNDPAIARSVFTHQPALPLRLDDFSAFVCNWEPKSANIRTIARQLNLGLDSLVFMDNDSANCAEVRATVPEVFTIEASGDSAYFPRLLDRLRLFEMLDLTTEDLARPAAYAAQARTTALATTHLTHEDFLRDLAMRAVVRPAATADLPRLEQLFKKTNQFNLTGATFEPDQLASGLANPGQVCLVASLSDRLGDHGLVSALIGRLDDDRLTIENWVMSCRVFARTFEDFLLNHLVTLARRRGAHSVGGVFHPTPKNDYARQWLDCAKLLATPNGWHRSCAAAPRPTFVHPAP